MASHPRLGLGGGFRGFGGSFWADGIVAVRFVGRPPSTPKVYRWNPICRGRPTKPTKPTAAYGLADLGSAGRGGRDG